MYETYSPEVMDHQGQQISLNFNLGQNSTKYFITEKVLNSSEF